MVNEFERRFARHRDELEWLFMELYDDRDALHRFEAMMREMWACREEELRALDRAREANPHWYRGANMLGMTMYTGLFAGNLRGVMERLPYLRELGVTYHDDPDRAADSRNLHRTRFDWKRAALRGKQGTPEHAIWEGIRQLREMRAHPCFAADARVSTLESGNRAVLAVCREKGNERMTAMMNFSEQAQSAMLPDGTSLELSAYEMRILGMCKQ